MVFIAQLATSGGVRTPLARIADQVFVDLTLELQNQGVTKKVIADMFGMALRTYHRRVRETEQSHSVHGRSVWEAVYEYVKAEEPVSGSQVLGRFRRDDSEVVSGVLADLVNSGLAFRSGRGEGAIYRAAKEEDFQASGENQDAGQWLVWLAVYRNGPLPQADLPHLTRLPPEACEAAVAGLLSEGKLEQKSVGDAVLLKSARFETPLGSPRGWEVAVLDHFQAMITAITTKLSGQGAASGRLDTTGGSTWSYDVSSTHPLGQEALATLARLRRELEDLRERIDTHNASQKSLGQPGPDERIVVYVGQYVKTLESEDPTG